MQVFTFRVTATRSAIYKVCAESEEEAKDMLDDAVFYGQINPIADSSVCGTLPGWQIERTNDMMENFIMFKPNTDND